MTDDPVRAHDPASTYVHLDRGPSAKPITVTADFWATIHERDDLHDGRLVTFAAVTEAWTTWEMHPHGDELIIVTRGRVRFHIDDDASITELEVSAPEFIIMPAGSWHTADPIETAELIIITWGDGTRTRPR